MRNCIKYRNLRAEMARADIGLMDISSGLGMNRDTLARKLSGRSPLYLDEAISIQRTFFPDVDVENLFSLEG